MHSRKQWNWKMKGWPLWRFDASRTQHLEARLQQQAGVLLGVWRHLDEGERGQLTVEALSTEGMTTSAIEGEHLDLGSMQSSLQRRLGLATPSGTPKPAEEGIAELMVAMYRDHATPLSKDLLCEWHRMLCNGRRDLQMIGDYRRHQEAMVIISGKVSEPTVHYEAPPSSRVPQEMADFIHWFNESGPSAAAPLPALLRAAIAHLYFESIHPFEDGNGRIGRTLVAKSIAQSLGQPTLLLLSEVLLKQKKRYYDELQAASLSLEVDAWIDYFAGVIIDGQKAALSAADFTVAKARFFRRHAADLNERQTKALLKVFAAGRGGFSGGLSAEKYISMTRASRATATRDLTALVALGAMSKTGSGKGTRYSLVTE